MQKPVFPRCDRSASQRHGRGGNLDMTSATPASIFWGSSFPRIVPEELPDDAARILGAFFKGG